MTMLNACQYIGTELGYARLQPTCTHTALAGRSYCAEHIHLVYQKGTARARRKKDERTAAQVWSVQDAFNEAVQELESEGYDFSEERWEVRELDLD